MLLIAIAGGAALSLGVIGVYSVVSYAANGRLRELGIRLALGAALGATRSFRALLYEVRPTSVAEFGQATLVLVVVTRLATLVAARRAPRTHPTVVLRGEESSRGRRRRGLTGRRLVR